VPKWLTINILFQVQAGVRPTNWQMFRSVWPVEDRPEEMQVEEWFNQMTTDYIFELKRVWDEKKKKDNKGEETFRRDAALPTRQYDGNPDNCTDLLHPARYNTQYILPH
jgi:hypothetical protein